MQCDTCVLESSLALPGSTRRPVRSVAAGRSRLRAARRFPTIRHRDGMEIVARRGGGLVEVIRRYRILVAILAALAASAAAGPGAARGNGDTRALTDEERQQIERGLRG